MSEESGRDYFTKYEASVLVGKRFETIVKLPDVSKGAQGLIIAADHQGSNWLIVIKWELHYRRGTEQERYSWFTKDEMLHCLREVKA